MSQALIGLGSNLGDRRSNLESAIDALAGTPGVEVRAVSTFHETSPVGGPEGQGAFLNAAASLETELDPEPLLDLLNAIEARAKRVRVVHWGARTLDLDLLLFDSQVIRTPRLTLPHPRMALRRFVLAPLSEIASTAVDPITTRSIGDLLANLDRRPSSLALLGDDAPFKEAIARLLVSRLGATTGPSLTDFQPLASALTSLEPSVNATAETSDNRWLITDSPPPFLGSSAPLSHGDQPTFVVILKQGRDDDSLAGLLHIPHLVVDSSDPDQVAAEVLAACAATRS
ncbi:2-amino-4-hydroxy-6-hydroxymethyldihydropteridine diphosphokinase [Singulisphaera acidiphila]|uniref:2-amino-4-hydroxy-6-hydroxymethyldihydropteridine pyrophosphokinase n=1 Tax=Singulisphaera acidiphila (strain ATCC BAA-1392 / DSM 18658 / VKM B-2454 / MOB10) TaxID=886293 RepID=L0DJS0_SINAD|nr:2-amino-4-hydroxy-6-hydroxymethyldihydropteridine diphosphokinase [Singulisphaera acidiphila]AGA29639.1 2-amino-4-hydroxy-6-hydroxymethyldihydropteridine pyrophosphokinase [Singulisphaera acidiphila DSM 18658]